MQNFELCHRFDRYQFEGCWIQFYLEVDEENERFLYFAVVELPNRQGCIKSDFYESAEAAQIAAEELVLSWN